MFATYCAVCHGATAKGDGPTAPEFKKQPIDLTMLAGNNNGKYPAERVDTVLTYETPVTAHGNIHMPVWKPLLHSLDPMDTTEPGTPKTQLRIYNIA
jgi:mono/diheme cytochrome c family protein